MLSIQSTALAYSGYTEDNPFVEAMLRMMEVFGLIDRSRLPLGVPYLPSYGTPMMYGMSGYGPGGFGGYPGMSGLPGMTGFPGTTGFPGMTGYPGMSSFPGGWPGGGYPMPSYPTTGYGNFGNYSQQSPAARAYLDGAWETDKGGVVIIRGNLARLYIDRDQYQDFMLGYDRSRLWWKPYQGGTANTYQYEMRDGRMVMRDADGNYLLLRRRK